MNIQFNNFVPINSVKLKKNYVKNDISFKGNGTNEQVDNAGNLSDCNYSSVQIHPIVALNLHLLKDGYTKEEINEHSIFFNNKIKNVDFANPNLLEAALQGLITKEDIFSKQLKSNADINAMQKAYTALKEKFNTQDVRSHVIEFNRLGDEIAEKLAKKGFDLPNKPRYSEKSMILSVLHYVNKDNEPLLQHLLDDKTFNNVHLHHALMSIDENKDMKYPMQVLKMAQEIGYKKEFSLPLAIIISEANETNMGMIEKMLYEQDFLSENDDFVSTKLMNFLREAGIGLSLEYEKNDDITLKEVEELLNLEELSDEE